MNNKKVDIFKNGKYIASSTQYKNCKEAKEKLSRLSFVFVAGRGLVGLYNERITVRYA